MSQDEYAIPATECLAALVRNHVEYVVTVPDWVQLSLHDAIVKNTHGIELINCCSENQTLTVAAGLTVGGKRPLLMMQNQGLYNCINTLRAVCLDAHIPAVLMVGQFGREYANLPEDPKNSGRSMVYIMEPVLDALGIQHMRLDSAADLPKIDEAYALAQANGSAVVLLVSGPMAWS
jgi:sulfopyruvate decarboxylase TPP-binding subunit